MPKVNTISLTDEDLSTLISLIEKEMDDFCGDRGFAELYKLRQKLTEFDIENRAGDSTT